jgi:hypothetical protein
MSGFEVLLLFRAKGFSLNFDVFHGDLETKKLHLDIKKGK